MKNIEFTQENYLDLLEALGDNAPACTRLTMKLRTSYNNSVAINDSKVELHRVSNPAHKDLAIEFEKEVKYGAWFTTANEDNGIQNQILVEFLGENCN